MGRMDCRVLAIPADKSTGVIISKTDKEYMQLNPGANIPTSGSMTATTDIGDDANGEDEKTESTQLHTTTCSYSNGRPRLQNRMTKLEGDVWAINRK